MAAAMPALTPSQTIGPFFHEGLKWAVQLSAGAPQGAAARVTGRMLDVDGNGVSDGLLEVWLPGWAASRESLPGFQRVLTGEDGRFGFYLPQPGAYAN
jgi:protocatechuate 3,4-dioxygenase alpha subunit